MSNSGKQYTWTCLLCGAVRSAIGGKRAKGIVMQQARQHNSVRHGFTKRKFIEQQEKEILAPAAQQREAVNE